MATGPVLLSNPVVVEKPTRSVYRVNYYDAGQPRMAFVCAYSGGEASAFLGVTDGSATATAMATNVEIAGVDPIHKPLVGVATIIAESAPPPQFSPDEMKRLRAMLTNAPVPPPAPPVK